MTQRTLAYFRASSAANVGGNSDVRQREAIQSYARRMRIEIMCRVVRGPLTVGRVARARQQPGDRLR